MANLQGIALRLILVILGGLIVHTGIDNAFGGVATLGWQVSPDFFSIEKEDDFFIRDNHLRFIGGIWLAMGLVFLAAAYKPAALRDAVVASTFMIFVGGLARFTIQSPGQVFGAELLPSVIFEFVVFPLIAWWLVRYTQVGGSVDA